jgi:hypothetical protein
MFALLSGLLALGTVFPLAMLLRAWDRRDSLRLILLSLQILFLVNAALAILQSTFWAWGWQDAYWALNPGRYGTFFLDGQGNYDINRVRASGLTAGANALGCLTAMAWPLVPGWGWVVAWLMVGLTGSRALALAVICQMIAWALLRKRPGSDRKPILWLAGAVTAMLALAGALLFLGLPGRPALMEIRDIRSSIWSMALGLWPWWWAAGLPPGVMDNLVNLGSFDVHNPTATARLHSTVLDLAVNHGLLGGVLIMTSLGVNWPALWRLGRRRSHPMARGVILGLVGAWVTMATEDQGVSPMLMGILAALMMLGGLICNHPSTGLGPTKPVLVLSALGLWVTLRLAAPLPAPLEVWTNRAQDHAMALMPPDSTGALVIRMGRPAPGLKATKTWTAEIVAGQLGPWQAANQLQLASVSPTASSPTILDTLLAMHSPQQAALQLADLPSAHVQSLRSGGLREQGSLSFPLPRRMTLYRGLNEAAVLVRRDSGWSLLLAGEGPYGTYGGVLHFPVGAEVAKMRHGAWLLTTGFVCLALDPVPSR